MQRAYLRSTATLGLVAATAVPLIAQTELLDYAHHGDFLSAEVRAVAFGFPDQGTESLLVGTANNDLIAINLEARQESGRLRLGGTLVGLAVVPATSRVLVGDTKGRILIWDWREAKHSLFASVGQKLTDLAVSPDGEIAAAAGRRSVSIINLETRSILADLSDPRHKKDLLLVRFAGGSRALLTMSRDKVHVIWDLIGQRALRATEEDFTDLLSIDSTRSGLLAMGGTRLALDHRLAAQEKVKWLDSVKVVDFRDGKWIQTLHVPDTDETISSLALSPDNTYVAIGGKGKSVRLWHLWRGSEIARLDVPGGVRGLAFSPNGGWLAAGTTAGTRVWRVKGIIPDTDWTPTSKEVQVTASRTPLLDFGRVVAVGYVGFDASDEFQASAPAVSRMLQQQLAVPGIRLADRTDIDPVLREHVLRLQLDQLNEQSLNEISQLVRAEKLLQGDVRRLGSSIVLTVKLLDVANGVAEGLATAKCRQCTEEDLPRTVDALAEVLVRN